MFKKKHLLFGLLILSACGGDGDDYYYNDGNRNGHHNDGDHHDDGHHGDGDHGGGDGGHHH